MVIFVAGGTLYSRDQIMHKERYSVMQKSVDTILIGISDIKEEQKVLKEEISTKSESLRKELSGDLKDEKAKWSKTYTSLDGRVRTVEIKTAAIKGTY